MAQAGILALRIKQPGFNLLEQFKDTNFTKALISLVLVSLPYFSAYKTEAFPFQNNPKNLDPSYKTDLDI